MDQPGQGPGRTKTPPGQADPTDNGNGNGNADTTTTTSSSTTSSTTTTTSSSTTTTTTTPRTTSSSTTESSRQIVTTAVVTPTTVVVVGTSTITSTLPPTTVASSTLVPANSNAGLGSSLSSGARAGIIAGSVVGGVALIALIIGLCFCCGPCAGGRKRRKQKKDEDEAIRWPEIAASAEDRAALYPEPIHKTGRAGIGADEMEEVGAGGLAGAGAGAYAASRYPSTRNATLPSVPPSVYESDYGRPYSPPPGGAAVGPQHAYLNEAAVAPGPAAIDYQRTTPSPPRTYMASGSESDHPMLSSPHQANGGGFGGGNDVPPGAGALPLPGSDDGGHQQQHLQAYTMDPIDRPLSPREIGGGYAGGYDQEGHDGGRWRLGVVNDDPRDPYYQR